MTRRRRRLWFVLIAGVVVAMLAWLAFSFRVSELDQIKKGMTLAELEMVLGPSEFQSDDKALTTRAWKRPNGIIFIGFDENDRASTVYFQEFSHPFLRWISRTLGL